MSDEKTYKDISYVHKVGNKWQLTWPSGLKTTLLANNEEEVIAKIEEIITQLK